jgi:methylase of polypeptide subunit release factors
MDARKANGVFYTPPSLVRYIVRKTIGPVLAEVPASGTRPRILDPACGDGAFLVEVFRYLQEHAARRAAASEHTVLLEQVFGVDIDATALATARRGLIRMAAVAGEGDRRAAAAVSDLESLVERQLREGDALLSLNDTKPPQIPHDQGCRSFSWRAEFPAVFADSDGGFDAIVGNPPYVNIRRLTRTRGDAAKRYFRSRYACARGAYDMYVLFVERAFQLLRSGGYCGFVVPNKIAAAEYARACRSLLLRQASLQEIVDVSEMQAFPDAGVYPYVIIWRKEKPRQAHQVIFYQARSPASLSRPKVTLRIRQSALCADTGFPLEPSLDLESRVASIPLAEMADLHSGTTGFVAQQVAQSLAEREDFEGSDAFEFIVSGNIDRYEIRPGDVRYMKRVFRRPVLAANCGLLTSNKRQLYRSPKIVVAGMTRRLEAAWDAGGLSLGVQVYAARPQQDPWFVLGVLNSKLMSYLYRLRFPAKHLAGGFLAINKRQLGQLPMRSIDAVSAREREQHGQVVRRVRRLTTLYARRQGGNRSTRLNGEIARIDREIDQLIYQLYALTPTEIERVETAFAA